MKANAKTIIQVYGGSPKKHGSLEDYFLQLAARLREEGYASVFVFDRAIDPALQALYDRVRAEIVIIPETPRRFDLGMITAFHRLFRRLQPVLVNFHFGRSCPNGLLAARWAGIGTTVWTKHSFHQAGPFYQTLPRRKLLFSMIYLQARLAQKLIAVSDGLRQELRLYGVPESKIARFYLGIDLARYRPDHPAPDLAAELGVPSGRRCIACISQARPEKGLSYLLQALSLVCARHPEVQVLILGGGPLTQSLQELAVDLGVESHVTFLGVRHDVPRILAGCDFSVLPSLTEGLPLALVESCASGKPVIASRVGGIPEVVTDGVNGFLVAPRDPQALADRMTLLLSDRDLRRRLGEAGAVRAREFDLNLGVAKTMALYQTLISSEG